jgi:hypothetical protein
MIKRQDHLVEELALERVDFYGLRGQHLPVACQLRSHLRAAGIDVVLGIAADHEHQ